MQVEEIKRDDLDTSPPQQIPREILEALETEQEADEDDDDDDFDDETLLERLVGLTEMFPEPLRRGASSLASAAAGGAAWAYASSRSLSWIVFSSGAVLFLPVMIETERMGIEEMQKQQQRQILLGPGAAVSGAAAASANAPLPPAPV